LRSNGGSAGDWALISVDTHTHTGSQVNVGTTANLPLKTGTNGVIEAGAFGTSAASFCEGNDARLSDDRDPNLHAASHAAAGSDPVFDQDLNTDDAVIFSSLQVTNLAGYGNNLIFTTDDGELQLQDSVTARDILELGTAAVEDTTAFAASGSITSSGLTQATARILGRTTASTGAVEEIQIGSGLSLSAGELSATGGDTVSIEASAADILSVASGAISADDAGADRIVFWDDSASKLAYLEAGSGLSLSGTTLTATATGTIGGSTSTDNAIVRADSTANTVQESALLLDDGTTSTQANVAIRNNHSETNSSVVITPKGTGAFILGPKPDGQAAVGGNARGTRAVDLQLSRGLATQVASGADSFAGGASCTASGNQAVAIGNASTASGNVGCTAIGRSCTASARGTLALGFGASMTRTGGMAFTANESAATGQATTFVLRGTTTTNAAVELATGPDGTYLTIPSGVVVGMIIQIVGASSTGATVAHYVRQYAIKNVAGTTSEVYAPVTIGADNAASTSIAISAADVGDRLKIECTGLAATTIKWTACVECLEINY
jgi:hypothetical protein